MLYPMKCPNRAAERRPDIIGAMHEMQGGYSRVVDLSGAERGAEPHYFEGTGGGQGEWGGGATFDGCWGAGCGGGLQWVGGRVLAFGLVNAGWFLNTQCSESATVGGGVLGEREQCECVPGAVTERKAGGGSEMM